MTYSVYIGRETEHPSDWGEIGCSPSMDGAGLILDRYISGDMDHLRIFPRARSGRWVRDDCPMANAMAAFREPSGVWVWINRNT